MEEALKYLDESQNQLHRPKYWCFTLFYDHDAIFPTELPDGVGYLVYQRELCPDTGREHVQGYVQFDRQYRLLQAKSRIQRMFHTSASPRLALAMGDAEQNRVYCTKLSDRIPGTEPVEVGEPGKRGKRNDLIALRPLILSGVTPSQALLANATFAPLAIRHHRSWKSLVAESIPKRDSSIEPNIIVLYGVSRAGKSKYAHATYPDAYIHADGKWWDDYSGEKEVIYDDFDGGHCTFGEFKRWFDRYPVRVEVKGAMCQLSATTHIVTTNVYPSHWWSKKVTGEYGRDAIWGRISKIWHYHTLGQEPIIYEPAQFRALPDNEHRELLDPKRKDL